MRSITDGLSMMAIQAWVAENPVLAGVVSTICAYLLWAVADRLVLQRRRKGPIQWPILGNVRFKESVLSLHLCVVIYGL